jgi:hypothetical protein
MVVVAAIVGFVAMIAIAAVRRAHEKSLTRVCVLNLRSIEDAKQQWAIENRKTQGAACGWKQITPYFRNKQPPACPANGTYRVQRLGRDPYCSYWPQGHILHSKVEEPPDPE